MKAFANSNKLLFLNKTFCEHHKLTKKYNLKQIAKKLHS